jgi:hypothetical protein
MISYHPAVILPFMRHIVFLEEYVCRQVFNSNDASPWRYESSLIGMYSRLEPYERFGFTNLPLGHRSAIHLPSILTQKHYEYLESQSDHFSLSNAPPLPRPLSAVQSELSSLLSMTSNVMTMAEAAYDNQGHMINAAAAEAIAQYINYESEQFDFLIDTSAIEDDYDEDTEIVEEEDEDFIESIADDDNDGNETEPYVDEEVDEEM